MLSKKVLRMIAMIAIMALLCGCISGCGGKEENDGKITISVGNWIPENGKGRDVIDRYKEDFMKKYPNIVIEPDTWAYDTKTFMVKASANQLPTLYTTHFTELEKIQKGGYAADITDAMKKYGIYDAINPELMELVTDENGRVMGMPTSAYTMSLYINKALFKQAGLVNEDGSIKVPQTYKEMAEYAQIIKEKTGKAGLALPTSGNGGGWIFLNIAWAFGVEFEEQDADGKWKATFDTPEFRNALQYVHDLKWKHNALLDNSIVDLAEFMKQFGIGEAGMCILHPAAGIGLSASYGINIEDIAVARLPEGDAGRFAQMGGTVYVISPDATEEEIDACMKWMQFYHKYTPEVNDELKESLAKSAKESADQGRAVLGRSAYDLWVNPERIKATEEAEAPFVNVDPKDYDDYFSFKDVKIRPEPAAAAQELYSVLDNALQEVITNKDANIDQIATQAVKDFQTNHLDKME